MALDGIDFDLKKGKLTLLMGPSGSGKSTLLAILSTLLSKDEGELLLFDKNIESFTSEDKEVFRRKSIGLVFDSFRLIPSLNVWENVSIPLLANDIPDHIAKEKALNLLDRLHIAEFAERAPNTLSNGQQQRVAIARAVIHSPQLIMCDEPTSALDHHNGMEIMNMLKQDVLSPERAVLVVTHDPRIYSFADELFQMSDGKIVIRG